MINIMNKEHARELFFVCYLVIYYLFIYELFIILIFYYKDSNNKKLFN